MRNTPCARRTQEPLRVEGDTKVTRAAVNGEKTRAELKLRRSAVSSHSVRTYPRTRFTQNQNQFQGRVCALRSAACQCSCVTCGRQPDFGVGVCSASTQRGSGSPCAGCAFLCARWRLRLRACAVPPAPGAWTRCAHTQHGAPHDARGSRHPLRITLTQTAQKNVSIAL